MTIGQHRIIYMAKAIEYLDQFTNPTCAEEMATSEEAHKKMSILTQGIHATISCNHPEIVDKALEIVKSIPELEYWD